MKKRCYLLFIILLIAFSLSGCKKDNVISMNKKQEQNNNAMIDEQAERLSEKSNDKINENTELAYQSSGEKWQKQYDAAMDKYTNNRSSNTINPRKGIIYYLLLSYYTIKEQAIAIGIISVFLGVLIFLFSSGNRRIKKFGLCMAVFIPILLILVVFGVGYYISILY